LKYWLLTTEYPPFFGGGIGTYCAITARMMAEKGHEISVFVNDSTVKDHVIEQDQAGVRLIRFNPSRTQSSDFLGHVTNISYEFAAIIKLFIEKEGKPDIIEAQEYLGIAYYLLQFKYLLYDWCADIPIVITMHSPSFLYMEYNHVPEFKYPNYWICEMERFCLQAADLLISPSNFMLAELKKRFELHHDRIAIIPNPFSAKTLNIQSTGSTSHQGEIVFYGKLTVQKGAFLLLEYFQKMWDAGFSRPLYLLGGQDIVYHPEGRTMGEIIRKKYRQFIEKGLLKLEGKIKPSEIANRLSMAEVVIIPSANDNLPYTVFEMMSLGKILLVSKQGGQSEVVENDVDGFVFDHKQQGEFSRQLERVLKLDQEERIRISSNAITKLESRYHPEIIYERKFAEISKLISTPERPRDFPFIRAKAGKSEASIGKSGLISIIVPYYNMGRYIEETIQSISGTSYPSKEIIIVNDGSNDPISIIKLDQFRKQPDITVIDIQNSGVAIARNIGAEKAKGEYLAFLDADDKFNSSYYSKAVKVLEAYNNLSFAGCWTKYFDKSVKTWPGFSPEVPMLLFHNTVNSSSLVYKRVDFLKYGKNDSQMAFQGLEDYESVISLLESNHQGVILPEALFHYRVRNDSMIRGISKIKKFLLYQYIIDKHKEFYATFAAEVFYLLNANGPGQQIDNPSLDYHLSEKIPFTGSMSRKLVSLVKRNEFTRRIAYKLYRILNR